MHSIWIILMENICMKHYDGGGLVVYENIYEVLKEM